MLRPIAFALLLVVAPAMAVAQMSKTARIERIARAVDDAKLYERAQEAQIESTKQAIQNVLTELRKSGVPDSRLQEFTVRIEDIAVKTVRAWDPKEASRIYAAGLVEALTEKEQAEVERYYLSNRGRKIFAAIASSQARTNEYIQAKTNEVLQLEISEAVAKIRGTPSAKAPPNCAGAGCATASGGHSSTLRIGSSTPASAADYATLLNRSLAGQPAGESSLAVLDRPLRLISGDPPGMPPEAIDNHIVGEVRVDFDVDETGKVSFVRLVGSPNEVLAKAVVSSVSEWRFEPPTRNGKPATLRLDQSFTFRTP